MSKNKRERLTKRQVQQRLDKLLESGYCISQMDGKELDHLMWCQPSLYIAFMSKMDKRR
ncbi:hypothetical protein VPBG_00251 [Vibrio phage helene 12B3]|uniref:hypothetical protein n=1 Tax=Vibrio phage helene 12B3 TaxID=573173 RepID=UPI0002C0F317|nr:hypothetical protein VPBG_00251 [Vibrio phage helene 12B3]AGG58023.1 hypothetical protein VPBG_00251 [Vibrio phage helene 12B3]